MAGGAPKGNKNASRGYEAKKALLIALDHYAEHGELESIQAIGRVKTIILMWKPIIEKAVGEGDLAALKEIHDRLDGKPAQSVDLNADITVKDAQELTDEQLASIAAAGSK